MTEWIKCSDKLPSPGGVFAAWNSEIEEIERNIYFDNGHFFVFDGEHGEDDYQTDDITYWLPWPNPPE